MQRTICSIFFQPLVANRPYRERKTNVGFNTRFQMAAAKPGEFNTLVVDDSDEQQRNGSQQMFITPIYGEDLATDVVGEWRGHKIANEHGRPGIFVCAGSEPTKEELARENAIQTVWCAALCTEAEGLFVQGKRQDISQLHQEAARWLGREAYEWMSNQGQVTLTECPYCRVRVDSKALVCRECNNVIDFDRYIDHQSKWIEAQAKLEKLKESLNVKAEIPMPKTSVAPPLQPNKPQARA